MSEATAGPAGAAAPRGLDLAALSRWLERERPGLLGDELSARLITGGKSNLTYAISDGSRHLVVRRPPLGHVLATAHDMAREHRVIAALSPTAVPVPPAIALCTDPSVIGAPFYVMEFVEGTAIRHDDKLVERGAERTTSIVWRLVDTLAELHKVDYDAIGLGDFGRPEGYLDRQIVRWGKQLEASRSRELPGADELARWLASQRPVSGAPSIVHGDYRLDNALVDDADTITAIIDWEMSTLGDPLCDVGLMAVYQHLALEVGGDSVASAPRAPGYPRVDDVLDRYARASGRDLGAMSYYLAFSYFKLAVILEGIYYRYSQGQTVGEGFAEVGRVVQPLIEMGLDARR